jgi:hypothetical protein
MRSALRRLAVEGGLPAKALNSALKRIQTERAKWHLVAISTEILDSAERLSSI